ncbi:MbcA/ParS/Xre antitoxin family protein [Spirosoma sp. KNUC1025]|nr:MbcA/ParS/Xre antitoxin family protein [Spirosoma sp. KNUC1025]
MNHPSPILNGKKPVDLLDTQFGFQAVLDELIRIDWGVLA